MGTQLAPRAESQPYVFMKAQSSVIATKATVLMPAETEKLDWEVELGVVIGQTCRHVSVEDALSVIAGYTVFNDISARDLNRRTDYPSSTTGSEARASTHSGRWGHGWCRRAASPIRKICA